MRLNVDRKGLDENNSYDAWWYSNDKQLSIAGCNFKSRYPTKGYVKNEESELYVFVLEGSGSITIEDEVFVLNKSDVIKIIKGKKYFFQPSTPELKVWFNCIPAFDFDRHIQIDA